MTTSTSAKRQQAVVVDYQEAGVGVIEPSSVPVCGTTHELSAHGLMRKVEQLFPEFSQPIPAVSYTLPYQAYENTDLAAQESFRTLPKGINGIRRLLVSTGLASLFLAPYYLAAEENQTSSNDPWEWRFLASSYMESEARVTALEATIQGTKVYENGNTLKFTGLFDTLTGATPTGAVPAPMPHTVARPSGEGSYTQPANVIPLDDTFKDTRVDGSVNYEFGSDEKFRWSLGGSVSNEYDYSSLALSGALAWDMFKKNTTIGLNFSLGFDVSRPVGGIPQALSLVLDAEDEGRNSRESSQTKNISDILVSLTQLLGRGSILRVNLSVGLSDGYHNDPYKVLSRVHAPDTALEGQQIDRVYENRPRSRQRTALYTSLKQRLGNQILDASYRFGQDDWGIQSNTIALKWRFPVGEGYLRPFIRIYTQDQADFYRQFLIHGTPLPTTASSDSRLGSFDAQTIGLEWGLPNDMIIGLDIYTQIGQNSPSAFGYLQDRELFPDLTAVVLKYSLDF